MEPTCKIDFNYDPQGPRLSRSSSINIRVYTLERHLTFSLSFCIALPTFFRGNNLGTAMSDYTNSALVWKRDVYYNTVFYNSSVNCCSLQVWYTSVKGHRWTVLPMWPPGQLLNLRFPNSSLFCVFRGIAWGQSVWLTAICLHTCKVELIHPMKWPSDRDGNGNKEDIEKCSQTFCLGDAGAEATP